MTAIDKVIQIAENEVGYLEKRNNAYLDNKTANAGNENYTKYWRDIKPSYQGQPWCACFVTWCFVRAFGQDTTKKLLKHYPYVYCPTMASLFTLNANPQRGDIVIFKHSGEFTHTGIVIGVDGDYFTTIEGTTSGGSTIIANGGAVCKKGYYNSNLPGTKFCRPDYSIVKGDDELMSKEYEELKAEINALRESQKVYHYWSEIPDWALPTVQKLYDRGAFRGDSDADLNLPEVLMRTMVINDRAGLYD